MKGVEMYEATKCNVSMGIVGEVIVSASAQLDKARGFKTEHFSFVPKRCAECLFFYNVVVEQGEIIKVATIEAMKNNE